MKLLGLNIEGFRGIQQTNIKFEDHTVIIGSNGSGKSTIIDALSLVFGRTRLVRDLTEHDFWGSCPTATSRIRVVATLGGFSTNNPNDYIHWFREGRAVPKWWNRETREVDPEPSSDAHELCAQIGFAARFDLEELEVEQIRYFHDDDETIDVFLEDAVQQVPRSLYDDIGYYVLPAQRTWEASVSFASELFRKSVATVGGIPAETILNERDRLRQPSSPIEHDAALVPLVERINDQLAQLLPNPPQFQLRVTNTDSDSLLKALVPHYQTEDVSLPVRRHGTGVLSLQTFILLLELGRERRNQGRPFLLAMEEPELHVPPGIQRRLIAQAVSIAEQTICTSHSPRVAACYPASSVLLLEKRARVLSSTPLLEHPLEATATNAVRKLYHENRPRVIEALMQPYVVIPEGRCEFEWFELLVNVIETSDREMVETSCEAIPFGSVVGIIPTHDSAVLETFRRLRQLRVGLVPLVDGDSEGNEKIRQLRSLDPSPDVILQCPEGWTIEDVVGWILRGGDENLVLGDLIPRIGRDFEDINDLIAHFKVSSGAGRLKHDYLAYQEIGAVIRSHDGCLNNAEQLLAAITLACLGRHADHDLIERDDTQSVENCLVLRFRL